MITGTVTPTEGFPREATITLDILQTAVEDVSIEAVIDTGFTGYLTLPSAVATSLELPQRGAERFVLADGSEAILPVYRGVVLWHGRERRIPVYETEGAPLIGMALLYGSRLTLDAKPGGEVTIEQLR